VVAVDSQPSKPFSATSGRRGRMRIDDDDDDDDDAPFTITAVTNDIDNHSFHLHDNDDESNDLQSVIMGVALEEAA